MPDDAERERATLDRARVAGALVLPPAIGDWRCEELRLVDDERAALVRFRSRAPGDWVEVVVTVGAPPPGTRPFTVLSSSWVRYRGQLTQVDDAQKALVRTLVLGIGEAIDARLAAMPEPRTMAAALGRRARSGPLVFSRAVLRELLEPEIGEGRPVAGGWTLLDVFPTSYVRPATENELELVLDFRREADRRRALFVVGRARPDARGFLKTAHFAVSHLSLGVAEPEGLEALRALLGFVLQLRDSPELDIRFPDVLSDVDLVPALAAGETSASLADGEAPAGASLNLALQAECGQSCAFCSIKETLPASDGGERELARIAADLAASHRRGVRSLRLNGYDPLAYSHVLDVLRHALALGYEHVEVFSPCTRLADPAFARAVLELTPSSRVFHVPLYATDPAIHDRLVGRPGAHTLVVGAIENLVAGAGTRAVHVLSVVCAENHVAMPALAAWCEERGFAFSAHLPYPSFESKADRFFRATPRQTVVVEAFVPTYLARTEPWRFPVDGVAPCVAFRGLGAHGVPPKRWLVVPEAPPLLPGTEYRDPRFRHGAGEREAGAAAAATVPCPHRERCALREACAGEILRSYVELHGGEEFRPVSLAELVASA